MDRESGKQEVPVLMVTIRKVVYDDLIKDHKFLTALYNAGVDNWDGYQVAVESLGGDEDE